METYIKQTFPISNTGVKGFKTEAVDIKYLSDLCVTIKNYLGSVLADKAVNFEYVEKVNRSLKLLKS